MSTIRLSEIDPLAFIMGLSSWGVVASDALLVYAQTGKEPRLGLQREIDSLLDEVYMPKHPAVAKKCRTAWDGAGEPTHAVDVVMRAAHARLDLAKPRGVVSVQRLAALAGVSVATIRTLGLRGLRIRKGDVDVREARAWLKAREVPGF